MVQEELVFSHGLDTPALQRIVMVKSLAECVPASVTREHPGCLWLGDTSLMHARFGGVPSRIIRIDDQEVYGFQPDALEFVQWTLPAHISNELSYWRGPSGGRLILRFSSRSAAPLVEAYVDSTGDSSPLVEYHKLVADS